MRLPDVRREWRRLFRVLHRDIGYLLFALTTVYAVSGIAVNHVRDWNPNYAINADTVSIGPLSATDPDAMQAEVVARLGLDPDEVTGRRRPSPDEFTVFLAEGGQVRLDTRTGEGEIERFRPRPLLYGANALHLNRLKGAWTYVADVFALLLFFLAFSGLFLLKGRTGLGGRGKWFVALGIVIPIAFALLYRGGH